MTAPELSFTRTCPYAPPAEHVRLRNEEPVALVSMPRGQQVWALTRLADIRAVLADPRFSSERKNPGHPHHIPGMRTDVRSQLVEMDPPEHTAMRRAVIGEFTVKRMAQLRPRIQQIVDEHLDTMLAGPSPADLVQALALPVTSLVICELLGVPYADHESFQALSAEFLRMKATPEERGATIMAIQSYIAGLVTQKVQTPTDDLLSRQLARGTAVNDVVDLGFLLLVAGHETTANQISLGVMTLLEHPERRAELQADPNRMLDAIEELLRYFTIAEMVTARVATEDVEVGGVLIHAGEGVIALGNTANRDPAAFENGDALDFARGARHHVAFGFGAHQCLGQNLARLELQIVFETVIRRVPSLALAKPVEDLPFKENGPIYGLYGLPVTWES